MPEKLKRVDWMRHKLTEWFATTAMSPDSVCQAVCDAAEGIPGDITDTFCLTINGIEVPVLDCMKRLERHMDEEIEKKATKLFQERIGSADKINALSELFREFTNEVEAKMLADFGFRPAEPREY